MYFRPIAPDEVFTGTLNPAGTESFRLSSQKLFGTFGGNMQNMPPKIRKAIRARDGHVIVSRDQYGAEAKIVGYEAQCKNLVRCFDLGIKPHTLVALNIFIDKFLDKERKDSVYFKPPDDLVQLPDWTELNRVVTKSGDPYALGKKTVHASNYMMSWHTFMISVLEDSQGSIILTPAEAKTMLASYFKLFPEVRVWQEYIREQVEQYQMLYNLFGEPRTFVKRPNSSYIRSAVSFIAQSTVAEITNRAAIKFQRLAPPDWAVLTNKHDELIVECPEDDAQDCAKLVADCLDADLTTTDGERHFKMTGETKIGKHWSE